MISEDALGEVVEQLRMGEDWRRAIDDEPIWMPSALTGVAVLAGGQEIIYADGYYVPGFPLDFGGEFYAYTKDRLIRVNAVAGSAVVRAVGRGSLRSLAVEQKRGKRSAARPWPGRLKVTAVYRDGSLVLRPPKSGTTDAFLALISGLLADLGN